MTKTIFFAFLLNALSLGGFAQANGPAQFNPSVQERHRAYVELNREIYARHGDEGSGQSDKAGEKFKSASQQLYKMVSKEIELALASSEPSPGSITTAISNLQGEMTLSAWGEDGTNTPFADFFSLNSTQTAAIAYVIMQGGDATPNTQPYLKFYDKASGVWQERATAPTLRDFEGSTFSIARLNSGTPSEAWFLAWGQPFGDSRGAKHIRLYAFDGAAVRTIWQRDSLNGGRITTTADTITIGYFDADDPSIEKREVFRVTPNGPELVTESSKQW